MVDAHQLIEALHAHFPPPHPHPPPPPFHMPMANPFGDLLKEVKPIPMSQCSLGEWLRKMREFFNTRNLMRILQLDLDPLTINDAVPQVVAGFNWAALPPQDLEGDRMCRYFLLQNVASHLVPSLEPLLHAAQIWRALTEVSETLIVLLKCVVWMRVMSLWVQWGRRRSHTFIYAGREASVSVIY